MLPAVGFTRGNNMSAKAHRWSELSEDRPMPLIARRRIIGRQMMVSRVALTKGFVVPTHQHENEQFAVVLSGRIRFRIGSEGSSDRRELTLGAGEVLEIPSNVPHAAEALEDTLILDMFAPPSEKTGVDRQ
jgi:quercetin dioxygenase-like cupin family protein